MRRHDIVHHKIAESTVDSNSNDAFSLTSCMKQVSSVMFGFVESRTFPRQVATLQRLLAPRVRDAGAFHMCQHLLSSSSNKKRIFKLCKHPNRNTLEISILPI
jgi:hypothetical protein